MRPLLNCQFSIEVSIVCFLCLVETALLSYGDINGLPRRTLATPRLPSLLVLEIFRFEIFGRGDVVQGIHMFLQSPHIQWPHGTNANTFVTSSVRQIGHLNVSGYRRRESVGTLRHVGHPLSLSEGEKKEESSDAWDASEIISSLSSVSSLTGGDRAARTGFVRRESIKSRTFFHTSFRFQTKWIKTFSFFVLHTKACIN